MQAMTTDFGLLKNIYVRQITTTFTLRFITLRNLRTRTILVVFVTRRNTQNTGYRDCKTTDRYLFFSLP